MRPYTDIEQSRLNTMTQEEKARRFDEASLKLTMAAIEYFYDDRDALRNMLIGWLKSLKESVQPQVTEDYNPYEAAVKSIAKMCKRYDRMDLDSLQDFYDNVKVKCKDAQEYDSIWGENCVKQ